MRPARLTASFCELTASFPDPTASFPNPTASFCDLTAAFSGLTAAFSGLTAAVHLTAALTLTGFACVGLFSSSPLLSASCVDCVTTAMPGMPMA